MTKKIEEIKKNIILNEGDLYLDYTASGLAYHPIEAEILKILEFYGNTHSEQNEHSLKMSQLYQDAKKKLFKYLNTNPREFYILPTGTGATGAIKKFQEIIGIYIPPATRQRVEITGDLPLVILGPYEHHSNEISFREGLCQVVNVPLRNGEIDLEKLTELLEKNKGREIYASFSLASNVTGILTPAEKISKILRKYQVPVAFDGATFSAYKNIDSKFYDALFLSPHKLLGGPGSCGLLVIRKNFFYKQNKPTFAGGGTVDYVSPTSQVYLKDINELENAGTPGILQLIRASLAYELRNEIGLKFIEKREEELRDYFFTRAQAFPEMILYEAKNKNRLPIFSFNLKNKNYD